MPAVEHLTTLGRTRLSFADEADIDEFVDTLERYERGDLTPDQWRAFRLVRGTYGQRQSDASMLRVKIPQGILDGPQLLALAEVADQYSRGFGHITTRQNVQLHFMKLPDVDKAMRRLAEAGLTTREACGNSVRNITACPYAGVSADEAFDVTPYSEALTRFLLRHPLSSTLPRKFKIAFEGCSEDHALSLINDLAFRALPDGGDGRAFQVNAGGGTAILCKSAGLLFERLPAGQIFAVAEAVLRVFHKLGDYKHKARNRMKFLIQAMGWDAWRAEFDAAFAAVRAEGGHPLPFDPENPPVEIHPAGPRPRAPRLEDAAARVLAGEVRGPGIRPAVRPELTVLDDALLRWSTTNVRPQKQDGFAMVTATAPLGDVTGEQFRVLAELAAAYGDGTIRTTLEQNLVLRWIRREEVPALYRGLAAVGLHQGGANTSADVTSCPGAEACRLAVTQSRGLGRLLADHLAARPDLVAQAPDLSLKISGCPNGCGQHHVAGLGFQGSVRKVGGKALPQYFVMLGGGVEKDGAHFGRIAAKIPARRIPEAVERLIALYGKERFAGEGAAAFFRRVDAGRVTETLGDLEKVTAEDAVAEDFVDLAEEREFVVETMGGECSA
jgi:sulfite reductase (NADPH) hemoprotein beta-component